MNGITTNYRLNYSNYKNNSKLEQCKKDYKKTNTNPQISFEGLNNMSNKLKRIGAILAIPIAAISIYAGSFMTKTAPKITENLVTVFNDNKITPKELKKLSENEKTVYNDIINYFSTRSGIEQISKKNTKLTTEAGYYANTGLSDNIGKEYKNTKDLFKDVKVTVTKKEKEELLKLFKGGKITPNDYGKDFPKRKIINDAINYAANGGGIESSSENKITLTEKAVNAIVKKTNQIKTSD